MRATRSYLSNNRTLRPESGLKRNPWFWGVQNKVFYISLFCLNQVVTGYLNFNTYQRFYNCLQATPVGASSQQVPIQLQSTQAKKTVSRNYKWASKVKHNVNKLLITNLIVNRVSLVFLLFGIKMKDLFL